MEQLSLLAADEQPLPTRLRVWECNGEYIIAHSAEEADRLFREITEVGIVEIDEELSWEPIPDMDSICIFDYERQAHITKRAQEWVNEIGQPLYWYGEDDL